MGAGGMDANRPHDLLFLHRPGAFEPVGGWPDWLDLAGAPLVVRREATPAVIIPAGARGLARSQRCKGYAPAAAVARRIAPEMLAAALRTAPPRCDVPWGDVPCLAALHALAPQLDALKVDWGPVGGVGYHLATGLPVLRADSDLDLLVRLPQRPAARLVDALMRTVHALQARHACRIDIQLDTGRGGCALAEYARGGRVLLKTGHGPLLVADPWNAGLPA
jgi:phosphoribosyl-dephospho-CoA transferase